MADKTNQTKLSQRKLEANRSNAKRSTGPTSEAGKAKAAQNSYKHGFFARRLFPTAELRAKDAAEYNQIYRGFFEHYSPEGFMENFWLEKITTEALRLARLLGFEQEAFGRMHGFFNQALGKLTRYQDSVTRCFYQATERLEALQRERKAESNQRENCELEEDCTTSDSHAGAANQSDDVANPNPAEGHFDKTSSDEREETRTSIESTTETRGTNPPNTSIFVDDLDDDLPSEEPDYDERDDGRCPRLTAKDLLREEDYLDKEKRGT